MWSYAVKVFRRSWRDGYAWVRDNVGLAMMMLVAPLIAVHLLHPEYKIDWLLFRTTAWLYLAVFAAYCVFIMVRSAFRLDKEHVIALQHVPVVQSSHVTSADWLQLSNGFKGIGQAVRADWSSCDGKVTWLIRMGTECEALCMRAGAMLSKSTGMKGLVKEDILSQKDHIDRWLEYVKDRGGLGPQSYFPDERRDGTTFFQYQATISDVPTTSSKLCLECSAHEI
jgi:hypothetical protein